MRVGAVAGFAALALALGSSPATAAVTIGQTQSTSETCSDNYDWLQPTVTEGNTYVVPSTVDTGTVTSWSTTANASGGVIKMKIFRPVSGSTYRVVGQDEPRVLTPNQVNTFTGIGVPVKAGDVLGLRAISGSPACIFFAADDAGWFEPTQTDLADGQSAEFQPDLTDRLNITAVVTPSNAFTAGATTRNKKHGTATLSLALPNPGELTASGKGAKAAAGARTSKSVGAGSATLVIRAKGKKKRKLNSTGKVKLKLVVTYTPTGGDPASSSIKVKLRKKL